MASNRDYLVLFAHGLQVIFALAVLAIGLYKMTHRHALIVVRTDTWIIGVSAKSLVIVTYQVCTDHISGLRKWRSLKANMILNIIETVFWIAAIVMTIMRMVKSCDGLGCILSGVVVGLGAILSILGTIMAFYSIRVWIRSRYENHNVNFATTTEYAGKKSEFSSISPNASKMGVRKA